MSVQIGSRYEPEWFETRDSHGTYRGKNAPMSADAMRVQDALTRKQHPEARPVMLWLAVLALAFVGAFFWGWA